MNFHTAEIPGLSVAVGFLTGQVNTTRSIVSTIKVPSSLTFRRLYVGWLDYNCGEPLIKVAADAYYRGNPTGCEILWEWQAGQTLPTGLNRTQLSGPSFVCQRRPYGSGNDWPYDLPVIPDSKMATLTYQDTQSLAWYHAQLVIPPYRFAEEMDELRLELSVTTGASMPSGGFCFLTGSIDSCKFPI